MLHYILQSLLQYYLVLTFVLFTILSSIIFEVYDYPETIGEFLKGYLFLDSVMIYIISLEILRFSLKKNKMNIYFKQNHYSKQEVNIISLLSAFPFGLGVTSFLKGISKEELVTAPISQGMTLSMLVYPTTLASGYIVDYFKINSLFTIFLYGLSLATLMIFSLNNISILNLFKNRLVNIIILLGVANFFYIWFISIFLNISFLIKQASFFILLSLLLNKKLIFDVLPAIISIRHQILFFMGVGIFGESLIPILSNYNLIIMPSVLNSYFIIFLPIIIVPVISILMIHPLVLFMITAPIITPYLVLYGLTELSIYTTWIIMLINSQLLSPVSLTTVLAVNKNNIFLESFIKHYKFVIKLSIVGIIYILIIDKLIKLFIL